MTPACGRARLRLTAQTLRGVVSRLVLVASSIRINSATGLRGLRWRSGGPEPSHVYEPFEKGSVYRIEFGGLPPPLLAEDDPSLLWPIDVAVASALRRTIDLVDLRRAPPLLRFEVARDGRPLIERSEGEWPRFKARAMIDWWDWAPIARRFHALAAQRLREDLRRV